MAPTDPRSVLLISANDLLWTGVHVALQSISDLLIVDDVTTLATAANRAAELQPEVVVTGLQLARTPTLPVLSQIRAQCPATRLVVLADAFGRDELHALQMLDVVACLLWRDLDFSSLRDCVRAAIGGDVVVVSRGVAQQLAALTAGQCSTAEPSISLSARERLVLEGLAAGLTQQQIARTAHLGLRIVKRILAALSAQLDAPSLFVLGLKAAALGIAPRDR